ncbi:hypothetical protein C8J57DRAFT_1720225 [Mycena rebaudengoi]|nr:hypothetical protein C8J57DRAFT_1720225 [Mycena rebaudengoi]
MTPDMPPALAAAWQAQITHTIRHAWASSTLDHYANGLSHFLAFCDGQSVPQTARLPASEFLLCAFAASHAGTNAVSTVDGKLAAVRAWHILNNVPTTTTPHHSGHARSPARHLLSPFDAAVFATATTAFWGQCRLGEVLSKWERSFDPKFIPSVKHLGDPCTPPGSRILHLPWTKTKGAKGDDVFISKQRGKSDAIDALRMHISTNRLGPDDPLFSFRTSRGNLLALTKKKFLNRCNTIWSQFGFPRLTGHSFRIGGTTELLIAGVPPDVVKMMGRWSSDAFLRYWRSLHRVAPLHAELLTPTRLAPRAQYPSLTAALPDKLPPTSTCSAAAPRFCMRSALGLHRAAVDGGCGIHDAADVLYAAPPTTTAAQQQHHAPALVISSSGATTTSNATSNSTFHMTPANASSAARRPRASGVRSRCTLCPLHIRHILVGLRSIPRARQVGVVRHTQPWCDRIRERGGEQQHELAVGKVWCGGEREPTQQRGQQERERGRVGYAYSSTGAYPATGYATPSRERCTVESKAGSPAQRQHATPTPAPVNSSATGTAAQYAPGSTTTYTSSPTAQYATTPQYTTLGATPCTLTARYEYLGGQPQGAGRGGGAADLYFYTLASSPVSSASTSSSSATSESCSTSEESTSEDEEGEFDAPASTERTTEFATRHTAASDFAQPRAHRPIACLSSPMVYVPGSSKVRVVHLPRFADLERWSPGVGEVVPSHAPQLAPLAQAPMPRRAVFANAGPPGVSGLLTFTHYIVPTTTTPTYTFSSLNLTPKNYLNASEAGPNPFDFCPIYAPGDEIGAKHGAVTQAGYSAARRLPHCSTDTDTDTDMHRLSRPRRSYIIIHSFYYTHVFIHVSLSFLLRRILSFFLSHTSICTLAHAFIHPSFSQLTTASSHLNYLHWHPIRFIPLTHIVGIFFSFHPIHCTVVS